MSEAVTMPSLMVILTSIVSEESLARDTHAHKYTHYTHTLHTHTTHNTNTHTHTTLHTQTQTLHTHTTHTNNT